MRYLFVFRCSSVKDSHISTCAYVQNISVCADRWIFGKFPNNIYPLKDWVRTWEFITIGHGHTIQSGQSTRTSYNSHDKVDEVWRT